MEIEISGSLLGLIGVMIHWFVFWSSIGGLFTSIADKRMQFIAVPQDGWIGWYWDNKKRVLYVMPLPFIGYKIDAAQRWKWVHH